MWMGWAEIFDHVEREGVNGKLIFFPLFSQSHRNKLLFYSINNLLRVEMRCHLLSNTNATRLTQTIGYY